MKSVLLMCVYMCFLTGGRTYIQMHSCKLLTETFLHLKDTKAEMTHMLTICGEEYEWLKECEVVATIKDVLKATSSCFIGKQKDMK